MLDGRLLLLSGFPGKDSSDADDFRGCFSVPSSKCLDGKRDEDNFLPLTGLEGLGVFATLSDFEGMAGNDGRPIHCCALKRIDDSDVVSGISAPNPAPDKDVGRASVVAKYLKF